MDKLIKYKIMQRVELVGGVPKWVTIDYYLTEKAAREAFWAAKKAEAKNKLERRKR